MLILRDFEKWKWLLGSLSEVSLRDSWGCSLIYRGRAFLILFPTAEQKRLLESTPESRDSQHSLLTLLRCVSAFLVKGHMERAGEDLCETLSSQLQD